MRFFSFFILLSFTFMGPLQAKAQGHGAYCSQADSTASTQNCLKRHLDSAQKRLNKIYTALNVGLDSEKRDELKALQKSWLEYRDAECMWEAARSENTSLKRINELSCMARVTEDRADILTVANDPDTKMGGVREYGSFPRWMNVVAKDNPDVQWDYSGRTGYDMNCDGEDEYLMQGVRTSPIDLPKLEEGDDQAQGAAAYSKEVVFAVTLNPSTGRPISQSFAFDVQKTVADEDHLTAICSDKVEVTYSNQVLAKAADSDDVAPNCNARLTLGSKGCAGKIITMVGKGFAVLELPVEEAKTKE